MRPPGVDHRGRSAVDRLINPWRDPRPFLVGADRTLTYAAIGERIDRYAAELAARGIRKGDRVAILSDSHSDLIVALFGHHRSGVVHVPINTRYRHEEVGHILTDAAPRLVVVDEAYAEMVHAVAPTLPTCPVRAVGRSTGDEGAVPEAELQDDDPALMIYTSGTTAKSKGVVLSYGSLVSGMSALTNLWQWSEDHRLVLALPLFHVHGLCIGVHGSVLHRMQVCLLSGFDPSAVVHAVAAGGTIFMGVPTMYRRLVDYLDRVPEAATVLRQARLFTSGSAPLNPAIFARFEAHTGHQIVERYGMSETLITLSNRVQGERRPGVVGRPVPGVKARVVGDDGREVSAGEVGELHVRGPSLMTGYWNLPRETERTYADGWFKTGDVVRIDERGDFEILGRKSVDIIKTGGFKVSAREIEDVLREHSAVEDVAVIGVDDPDWGQAIHAVVVPAAPATGTPRLQDEIAAFAGSRLADYKKPRRVHWVEALPRNALGKVQKTVLLKQFS